MPYTPSSDSATTRKPETAPPRMATWTAPTRLWRAAAAVRTLALTLTNMPMMPDAIEQAAPTRKAIAGVDAQLDAVDGRCPRPPACSTMAMMAPTTNAPTSARMAMVTYWRRMKATAPS